MNALTKALLSAVIAVPSSQLSLSQANEYPKNFTDVPAAVKLSQQRLDTRHVNVPRAIAQARQLGSFYS